MKPDERKQEDFGCERDARTFNQPSAVDESVGAAVHENSDQNELVGHPQSLNAQNIYVVGTISSTSGTSRITMLKK
jgi:hypothetical protein